MSRIITTDIYAILSNDLYVEAGHMRHPNNLLRLSYGLSAYTHE